MRAQSTCGAGAAARAVQRVALSGSLALLLTAGCGAPTAPATTTTEGAPAEAPAAESVRLVSFSTADGGVVQADEYGRGERAVVLAHGARFDKQSWAPQARALASEGLRVLAIDFRGYGDSHGPPGASDPYAGLHHDVLGAAQYLHATGARSVSVVGASMGGGALAEALVADVEGRIERAVLLAHSPIEHPEAMGADKLFLVARDDGAGNGRPRLPGIREQYERAPEPKHLVILEGSAHAQYLFESEAGPQLLEEIRRFLCAPWPPPAGSSPGAQR